jgi:hypothetical protein
MHALGVIMMQFAEVGTYNIHNPVKCGHKTIANTGKTLMESRKF